MCDELIYQHTQHLSDMAFSVEKPLPDGTTVVGEKALIHASTVEEFSELYERYREPLTNFLTRLRAGDAEDLLQDTFLHAWRVWLSTRVVSPEAWLYRIARNVVYDEWRRRKPVYQLLDEESCCAANCYVDDPCTLYLAAELCEAIYAIIKQLDPLHSQALWLRMQGLSYQHIGECVGLKGQTSCVKMRVKRAREQFRMRYQTVCSG